MIDSLDLPSDSAYQILWQAMEYQVSQSDLPNLHWLLCDKPEMSSLALLYTSDWSSTISIYYLAYVCLLIRRNTVNMCLLFHHVRQYSQIAIIIVQLFLAFYTSMSHQAQGLDQILKFAYSP